MKLVTFTVEEANRLLPEIGPRMKRLTEAKIQIEALKDRIQVQTLAVAGATKTNPDALELDQLHQERNRLAEVISLEITAVHRHGCVVKDLEQGLVDFYTLAGDRLVFLCWKLGEPQVSHWHSLDEGFERRQSLQSEIE